MDPGPSASAERRPGDLLRLLRWALALLFLVASGFKATDLRAFTEVVGAFGIVPDASVGATALALVLLEAACGALLLLWPRAGLALAAALLVVFLGVLAYGIRLGLDVECGCLGFGARGPDLGGLPGAFARDLVLLAGVGACALGERRARRRGDLRSAVDRGPHGRGESAP